MSQYGPPADILNFLSCRHAIEILDLLREEGPMRYSEIKCKLDIRSESTFSTRLQELEERGLVVRIQHKEMPPRVEYRLSEKGQTLLNRLMPVLKWAASAMGNSRE